MAIVIIKLDLASRFEVPAFVRIFLKFIRAYNVICLALGNRHHPGALLAFIVVVGLDEIILEAQSVRVNRVGSAGSKPTGWKALTGACNSCHYDYYHAGENKGQPSSGETRPGNTRRRLREKSDSTMLTRRPHLSLLLSAFWFPPANSNPRRLYLLFVWLAGWLAGSKTGELNGTNERTRDFSFGHCC